MENGSNKTVMLVNAETGKEINLPSKRRVGMDGSTIPYYVVEERKKLNRCIEEAPNDYEKEIYRAIRNMPVPYEKLNEILENSRDIITSKQNRKAKNRKFFATGIPIIFMILVVAIYTLLNKQGDD